VLYLIPALNLAGIPPFSGFIGKVALFDAGFHSSDWLVGILVGVGTLTSLLTLYVIGKSWNLGFWREPADADEPTPALVAEAKERRDSLARTGTWKSTVRLPSLMTGATAAMVIVSCLLTVLAQPLWQVSSRASQGLMGPETYTSIVLDDDEADGVGDGRHAPVPENGQGGER
ncbi:MAG: Na+/H+ antiporter subunit D, partial [Brevibacterium yomogidense]